MRAVVVAVLVAIAPGTVAAEDVLPAPMSQEGRIRPKTARQLEAEAWARLVPPSVEPTAYAAWLDALPKPDQRRIARFCRKNPVEFELVCGGIGPLHIPLPPNPLMPVRHDADDDAAASGRRSMFADHEAWWANLSGGQKGYVRQHCPPPRNEDDWSEGSDLCGRNTPLVLSFDGAPIELRPGATFAFAPGLPVATDWPTAATPWLVLDRDGDGAITSGAELFGGDTILPGGARARHGFEALAPLDDNHDGRVDRADPRFAELRLWRDADGDGRSRPGELAPLAQIVALELAYTFTPRCDARANCEGERGTFTWRDDGGAAHRGAIVDVYLPAR